MKKLFMFLAVAGLATFGASCSSDDGGGGDDQKTITLSADKTSVKVNETVTFTASEKDAEIYVGDKKISNSTKFDKEGSYNVIAKKKGFKDSNVVKITVTKGDVVTEKTLKITASAPEVGVGENVTFTVKDQDNKDVTDVVIKANGTTVSNPWKTTEAGSFEVVVTKDGYKDGKTTVKVVRNVTALVFEVIDPSNITEDTGIPVEVKDQDGEFVDGAVLNITGVTQTWTMQGGKAVLTGAPAGTYELFATFNGVTSNKVSVVVKPGIKPVGTGTVKFGSATENVTEVVYGMKGAGNLPDGGKAAVWTVQVWTKSWIIQSEIVVAGEFNANNELVSGGIPTGSNILEDFSQFAIFSTATGNARLDGLADQAGNIGTGYTPFFSINGDGTNPMFDDVTDKTVSGTAAGSTMTIDYKGDATEVSFSSKGAKGAKGVGSLEKAQPFFKIAK